MSHIMTLTEFRATGVDCADLSARLNNDFGELLAGRVYEGDTYLTKTDSGWSLMLGRDEWEEADIQPLEARLYHWLITEFNDIFMPFAAVIVPCAPFNRGETLLATELYNGEWVIATDYHECDNVNENSAMATIDHAWRLGMNIDIEYMPEPK